MADPLTRPLKWSKNFQIYVEKHNLYDVFQELLKQMIMTKPEDPLLFIKEQMKRTAKGIYHPKAFIFGSPIAQTIGQRLAAAIKAKFLTLEEIITQSDSSLQEKLRVFIGGQDLGDDSSRKILISNIIKRVSQPDCDAAGYIIYGFPQSKLQAICAQQMGLLPRQVFAFLPETGDEEDDEEEEENEEENEQPVKQKLSASLLSLNRQTLQMQFLAIKEIATTYHYDICKMITYEKLRRTQRSEIEAELLANLLTWKPSGAPFIPRIVIMGPPASGKSSIAEFLAGKFSFVNVDWIDLIRGAVRWDDEIATQAYAYLKDLKPMSNDTVKTILTRRLQKEDCEKKGWILHGFPENKNHCKILEELCLDPNRIFMLSCPQELSAARMAKKKKVVMKRYLDGNKPLKRINESGDVLIFPFGANAVAKRFEVFASSLDELIPHYGSRIIYVDASMKQSEVKNFVESSILRPPIPQTQ